MLAQRQTSPANRAQPATLAQIERELRDLFTAQSEWFMSEDGRAPVEVNSNDFEFTTAHGRLIFSSWTERGARVWRVTEWKWSGDKLVLQASRRMGAELNVIELVPRASAKAIVASIAAARQARCDQLAQLMSAALGDARIERAALSPGMRRDQPGRYARIILRRPFERIGVTGTVAQSEPRNVDALFGAVVVHANHVDPEAAAIDANADDRRASHPRGSAPKTCVVARCDSRSPRTVCD